MKTQQQRDEFSANLNAALTNAGYPPLKGGRERRVSEAFGVSHVSAGKWLKGQSIPKFEKLKEIANALNISPGDLITTNKIAEESATYTAHRKINIYSAAQLNTCITMQPQSGEYITADQYLTETASIHTAATYCEESETDDVNQGDLLIIDAQKRPRNNELAAVIESANAPVTFLWAAYCNTPKHQITLSNKKNSPSKTIEKSKGYPRIIGTVIEKRSRYR